MTNTIELDKNFFFGGNAVFTVESDVTGAHRTYKIRKTKPSPRFPKPACMVFLLVGANNETDYEYIGMVDENTGFFRLTGKSKRNENSPDVVIFKWVMQGVFNGMVLRGGKIHHEGKCGCCGRTLTVPESIKRGIGPECWSRICGA
jgi:hypothetical protein